MREDIKILDDGEIVEKLKDFPGWKLEDDKISKEFKVAEEIERLYREGK